MNITSTAYKKAKLFATACQSEREHSPEQPEKKSHKIMQQILKEPARFLKYENVLKRIFQVPTAIYTVATSFVRYCRVERVFFFHKQSTSDFSHCYTNLDFNGLKRKES